MFTFGAGSRTRVGHILSTIRPRQKPNVRQIPLVVVVGGVAGVLSACSAHTHTHEPAETGKYNLMFANPARLDGKLLANVARLGDNVGFLSSTQDGCQPRRPRLLALSMWQI